jgi:hypothetical protein
LRGHRELVDLMLTRGATNYNGGLFDACQCGHIELVELMLTLGATDYEWGLLCARQSGHLNIVLLLINKGATISYLNDRRIVQLLNIGLDPKLKHISACVAQKVLERKRTLNNAEQILNNCIPKDIIQHVVTTYVRYE